MTSAALRHGLLQLTPREREVFDLLSSRGWVDARELEQYLCYRPTSARNMILRLRAKLVGTIWTIERMSRAVRLTYRT